MAQRIQNAFTFIGDLSLAKDPVKVFKSESGWENHVLQAYVNESKNNGAKLDIKGGWFPKPKGKQKNIVYSFTRSVGDAKGEKTQIDWKDRKDPDIIREIANFSKYVVDFTEYTEELSETLKELRKNIYTIETAEKPTREQKVELKKLIKELEELRPDYHEFLHYIDMVEWFGANVDKVKGKRVKATGNISINYWNGQAKPEYVPSRIQLAREDEKNGLTGEVDLYYTLDSADRESEEQDKLVKFNAFIYDYDSGHRKDVLFPFQVVLNGKDYDFENPKHKAHYNIINKFMTPEKEDVVYQLPWTIKMIAGAEEKKLTYDDLTEEQKMLVDAEILPIESFEVKVYGDKLYETRLVLPQLKDLGEQGKFTSGAKETTIPLEALDYKPVEKEDKKKDEKKEDSIDEDPFANAENLVSDGETEISEDDLPF